MKAKQAKSAHSIWNKKKEKESSSQWWFYVWLWTTTINNKYELICYPLSIYFSFGFVFLFFLIFIAGEGACVWVIHARLVHQRDNMTILLALRFKLALFSSYYYKTGWKAFCTYQTYTQQIKICWIFQQCCFINMVISRWTIPTN